MYLNPWPQALVIIGFMSFRTVYGRLWLFDSTLLKTSHKNCLWPCCNHKSHDISVMSFWKLASRRACCNHVDDLWLSNCTFSKGCDSGACRIVILRLCYFWRFLVLQSHLNHVEEFRPYDIWCTSSHTQCLFWPCWFRPCQLRLMLILTHVNFFFRTPINRVLTKLWDNIVLRQAVANGLRHVN